MFIVRIFCLARRAGVTVAAEAWLRKPIFLLQRNTQNAELLDEFIRSGNSALPVQKFNLENLGRPQKIVSAVRSAVEAAMGISCCRIASVNINYMCK